MKLRWSHAVLLVRDMEEMIGFYTKVLGFEVTDRGPFPAPDANGAEIVFMSQVDTDHHQIAFVDKKRDGNPPNSVDHFAFRVDSLDDVKLMDKQLAEDGRVENRLPLTHGNAWSIYFKDPEGNGIEVFCDTPWHVQQPQGTIWDRDKSNAEIADETRRGFESEARFGPIEDFYAKRASELKDR
ncbi:MAG: VOC family protein [Deltaproteobacteria bacterium]|nr:VOC family protein [Deltaproteobacteria bacterium]MBW2396790.1 VOC family protein [Deltaproteobacteria bacterium]